MKTINVFAVPSHATKERTSGVDFARVIQPMEHLDGYSDGEVKFKVKVYDPNKDDELDWQYVSSKYDIFFFNYTAMPWEFAKMGMLARKNGIPLVMDCDDSLWDIMPDNPIYAAFGKGSENVRNFTAICREVDAITTTNKFLRNVISHNTGKATDKVVVLPNRIDLDKLYTHRSQFKDDGQITLLHFGSTTHFIDLQTEEFEKGIDMIMKEYPNVNFKTVGALIPSYKYRWGQRYQNSYGHADLYKWVQEKFPPFMDETDILVVPLQENRYTKCKSSIKYLEASSAKKPGVYQRIRQYQEIIEEGENGFTAYFAEDWYKNIKKLIDDKELRRSMGEKAFETVKNEWQMKDHVKDYADLLKSLV